MGNSTRNDQIAPNIDDRSSTASTPVILEPVVPQPMKAAKIETVCISDGEDDNDVIEVDPLDEGVEVDYDIDDYEEPAGLAVTNDFTEEECHLIYDLTKKIMFNHSNHYMGLSRQFLQLIDMITAETNVSEHDLILTLRKCKLNETFLSLADFFGISELQAKQIFTKNVAEVANFFGKFIFWPFAEYIEEHLPYEFKLNYQTIQSVIDCFHLQFDDPTKNPPMKYLVSYTPYGFINYISRGFGDTMASDTDVLKLSGYLEMIKTDVHVLVRDDGFVGAEALIEQRGGILFRARIDGVAASVATTGEDVDLFTNIAVVRLSIKRMVSRFNGFQLLKPYSTDPNLIGVMDNVMVVAGALINCKAPHIKLCE